MTDQHVHLMNDHCWDVIFKKLDCSHDIASLSLVSKKFLSITNLLVDTLRVSNLTAHLLPKLLQRFHQLKSITIATQSYGDCSGIMSQVLQSGLEHMETLEIPFLEILPIKGLREWGMHMKGLKKLSFSGSSCSDDDLIELSDLFPVLEDLSVNILIMVTDRGLEALASKLKRLKKITLYSCSEITDRSLVSLSSNCADLTDVQVHSCPRVTEYGIGFFMRHSSKLAFLSLSLLGKSLSSSEYHHFTIENSIPYAGNLEQIRFDGITTSNGVLCSIAKSCPRIKKIHLGNEGTHFSYHGLGMLLRGCSSLQDLTLQIPWLTDEFMLEICKHIRGLKRLDVGSSSDLSKASFFALIKACPSLESIEIVIRTRSIGKVDLHWNYQVKELKLGLNTLANDDPLIRFVSVCPNLERLCITSCILQHIEDEGIAECLEVCPKLWYLNVSGLFVSNFLDQNEDKKLKLKCILASRTLLNDEALDMIGKRCPYLESLEIEGCHHVTNNGIYLMASKCVKLRKINMNKCRNIGSIDVLNLLVNLRPSLKEVITPLGCVPSDEERSMFLRSGCKLISIEDSGGIDSDTYHPYEYDEEDEFEFY